MEDEQYFRTEGEALEFREKLRKMGIPSMVVHEDCGGFTVVYEIGGSNGI